jgi:hypothetical protein
VRTRTPCCYGVCPIARLSDGGGGAHLVLDLGLGVTPWLRGGNHAARAFLAAAVVGVAIVSTRVVNEGNGAASGRPDIDVLSATNFCERLANLACDRPGASSPRKKYSPAGTGWRLAPPPDKQQERRSSALVFDESGADYALDVHIFNTGEGTHCGVADARFSPQVITAASPVVRLRRSLDPP